MIQTHKEDRLEAAMYSYHSGKHMLALASSAIVDQHIKTHQYALDVTLIEYKSAMFLCCRFGKGELHCAPYNHRFVSEDLRRDPEDPKPGTGIEILTSLLDSTNGTVKAVGIIELSHRFSLRLNRCLREQLKAPTHEKEYRSDVTEGGNLFPDLLKSPRLGVECRAPKRALFGIDLLNLGKEI